MAQDTEILKNESWMSYEEYRVQQQFLREREMLVWEKMGLGWLINFLSKSNDNECTNDVHRIDHDPTRIGSADGQATTG